MCSCYGREGEQDCFNQICKLCGELPLLYVANDVSGNAGGCSMWISYVLGSFCDYVLKLMVWSACFSALKAFIVIYPTDAKSD
jgi:hypothetical protein